jgi:hypothetical protein
MADAVGAQWMRSVNEGVNAERLDRWMQMLATAACIPPATPQTAAVLGGGAREPAHNPSDADVSYRLVRIDSISSFELDPVLSTVLRAHPEVAFPPSHPTLPLPMLSSRFLPPDRR